MPEHRDGLVVVSTLIAAAIFLPLIWWLKSTDPLHIATTVNGWLNYH